MLNKESIIFEIDDERKLSPSNDLTIGSKAEVVHRIKEWLQ